MKRPGLGTVLSIFLNAFLSAWLINQYFYDQYFHNYVDTAISPVLPYLVLTIGIGGGSSLGYILLRRKHSETNIAGRLQKGKPPKHSGPLPSLTGTSLQSKNVPVGAPPGPASKHTAYAVPSLSKSSTQNVQKGAPSYSWSMAAKQSPESSMEQRQEQWTAPSGAPRQTSSQFPLSAKTETQGRQEPGPQQISQTTKPETPIREFPPSQGSELRIEPATRASPTASSQSLGEGLSRIPPPSMVEATGKTGSAPQWAFESSKTGTGSDKTNIQYSKPFPEGSPQPRSSFRDQPPGEGIVKTSQSPPTFQPLKPPPPDTSSRPGQWTDPVPRQGYSPPQKWSPPSISPVPSPRPQTPISPPQRPGQPLQGRPPFPGSQGPPRPLAYPGSMRQPPGRGVPGPFRTDQPLPPSGMGAQQRPPFPSTRPIPTQLTSQTEEKKETPSQSQLRATPSQTVTQSPSRTQPAETATQTNASGELSGGEMDWDTALDTILKTLRKDKVGDKP